MHIQADIGSQRPEVFALKKPVQGGAPLGIVPDVVLHPDEGQRRPIVSEAVLPRHLAAEAGAVEGDNAGEVLPGNKPIEAALAELRRMAGAGAAAPPAKPQ